MADTITDYVNTGLITYDKSKWQVSTDALALNLYTFFPKCKHLESLTTQSVPHVGKEMSVNRERKLHNSLAHT